MHVELTRLSSLNNSSSEAFDSDVEAEAATKGSGIKVVRIRCPRVGAE
jgi:hypothetical protein